MPKELTDVVVNEVSLVPKGANKRRFLLMKSEGGVIDEVKALQTIEALDKAGLGDTIERLAATNETAAAADLLAKAGLSDADGATARAAFRVLGEDLTTRLLAGIEKAKGDGEMKCPKCGAEITKTAKFCSACGKGLAKPTAAEEAAETEEEEQQEEAGAKKRSKKSALDLSAVPEAQRQTIEALLKAGQDEVAELKARVEKEEKERQRLQDEAEIAEYTRQAKELSHLPGANPDDMAPVLRKAARGMEPAEYEKLRQVLKGADAGLADAALFAELGSAGTGAGSAYEKIGQLAAELRKADPTLTVERARAKIVKSHPELYAEHQAELDDLKRRSR